MLLSKHEKGSSTRSTAGRTLAAGMALFLSVAGSPARARAGGMDGYLSYNVEPPPESHVAGVGFYSAVWPLIAHPLDGFQVGLPGTWILPNNDDDTREPLCPKGTLAGDNWPERGPTYRDVFQ